MKGKMVKSFCRSLIRYLIFTEYSWTINISCMSTSTPLQPPGVRFYHVATQVHAVVLVHVSGSLLNEGIIEVPAEKSRQEDSAVRALDVAPVLASSWKE